MRNLDFIKISQVYTCFGLMMDFRPDTEPMLLLNIFFKKKHRIRWLQNGVIVFRFNEWIRLKKLLRFDDLLTIYLSVGNGYQNCSTRDEKSEM